VSIKKPGACKYCGRKKSALTHSSRCTKQKYLRRKNKGCLKEAKADALLEKGFNARKRHYYSSYVVVYSAFQQKNGNGNGDSICGD